ncbi:discoidin domain-containing protein [Salinispora arenicola]|uniref:discoidin domain-containing protein n=1 Tax=Salinispora arenicola TaxID=168697 RepID=UPI0003A1CE17
MDSADEMIRPVTPGNSALEWLSDSVAVVGGLSDEAVVAVARSLPVAAGEVTVLGQLGEPPEWSAVTEALSGVGASGVLVRLAVSGAGSEDGAGPAPAAVLAQRVGVDVLAPVGLVVMVPGGTLFADAGWRRFGAGSAVSLDGDREVESGRRLPAPDWELGLDSLDEGVLPAGLVRKVIPAGTWLYPGSLDQPATEWDDLAYTIAVDANQPVLLVGRPGAAVPDPDAVVAAADALPRSVRGCLIVVPFGPGAVVCAQVSEKLARRWGRTVTMATGLPIVHRDNRLLPVAVDAKGSGRWSPPVPQLSFPPSGRPSPAGPVEFLVGLSQIEPGAYRITARWAVEVVQSGLWLRPLSSGELTPAVRERPWQAEQVAIAVGLPGHPLDADARLAIRELLARMPAMVRRRVEWSPREAEALASGHTRARNRPDIMLVLGRTGPPTWWQADERVFSVVIAIGETGQAHTEAGEVGPGELGELITVHAERDDRPILLASDDGMPQEFCQRVADQVPAVVIGGGPENGGWFAVRPRQAGRGELPSVRLGSEFPFADHDLEKITEDQSASPASTEVAQQTLPVNPGTLDLRTKRSMRNAGERTGAAANMPERVVLLGRGPDARTPFRVFGKLASEWQVAVTVAAQRPRWIHCNTPIRVDVDAIDPVSLQLLANYLDAPLAVLVQRASERSMDGDEPEWITARPRWARRKPHPPRVIARHDTALTTPRIASDQAAHAEPAPNRLEPEPAPENTTKSPVPWSMPAADFPIPLEVDRDQQAEVPAQSSAVPPVPLGAGGGEPDGPLPVSTKPDEPTARLPALPSNSLLPVPPEEAGPTRRRSRRALGTALVAATVVVTVAATSGAVFALRDDVGAGNVRSAAETVTSPEPTHTAESATSLPTLSMSPVPLRSPGSFSKSPATRPTPAESPQASTAVAGRSNPAKRNLALGRAAGASSTESSAFGAGNVVDGDRMTRWSSAWGTDQEWLAVDLGSIWNLSEVRIAWEDAYAVRYRVELSNDGTNWSTVYSTSSGTGGTVKIQVKSEAARYVRVVGMQRATMWGYSLWEFEVR